MKVLALIFVLEKPIDDLLILNVRDLILSSISYNIYILSYLILSYLSTPSQQQAKPGRSLLHVHHPRHLWHLGHAGCRHLCKGHFFFFARYICQGFDINTFRRTTFRLGSASTSTLELSTVVVTCLGFRSLDTFCSSTMTFFLKGFSSCLPHCLVTGLNLCSSSVY